ncbi:MAG: HD domain-containing protein, partial [Candidatus Pacearchaeota archaeon]
MKVINNFNEYPPNKQKLLEKVKKLCKFVYPTHNWEGHILPTVEAALKLQKKYGGDRFIVETGAYMHDLGRILFDYLQFVGVGHEVSGYYFTRAKLWQYGFNKELNEKISKCVLQHGGRLNHESLSLESEIIRNADGVAAFEKWMYQYSIHYAEHSKDEKGTKKWLLKKLDSSWRKLTL